MTIVIDGTTGISGVDGTASNPSYEGTDSNTGIFFPAADTVAIGTGGTEALRVNSSQNVGIGTSSPTAASSRRGLVLRGNANGAELIVQSTSATDGTSDGFSITTVGTDAYLFNRLNGFTAFATNNTERARINSGGYFKASNTGAYVGAAGTYHELRTNAVDSQVVLFTNAANSGPYGLTLEFENSDPNNAINWVFRARYLATNIYTIWSNGTVTARSDAKWKKNIETARDGYAEDLAKLRVVKYNWYNHEEGEPKELGLIAQEVEQVFPGLVMTETDDEGNESKSIKVSVIQTMMLKAIQELNAKVDAQAAEIAALKAQP